MESQKINTRNTVLILMILGAVAMRFVTYKVTLLSNNAIALSNFTPVGAVAYLVPLCTLFVSDMILNYLYSSRLIIDYSATIWVYLSFAIIVFIGTRIKKVNLLSVGAASVLSVVIFWLLTDFPWLYGGALYPHTLLGYEQSLIAAIPFQRNMLLGDVVFGLLLFGGFELAKSKFSVLRTNNKLAV